LLDGYSSAVQGLLVWFEVILGCRGAGTYLEKLVL